MKIKTISRSEEAFTRECKGDVVKVFRNLDPTLHPFDKAREYTRALQATKLDKVFAKPLVGTCVCVCGVGWVVGCDAWVSVDWVVVGWLDGLDCRRGRVGVCASLT